MSFKYFRIELPEDIQASIDRYVQRGIPAGGFLQAVIENDLREAVGRADERNLPLIPVIVAYLYNECPMACWGRRGVFREWISQHCKREAETCARNGVSRE